MIHWPYFLAKRGGVYEGFESRPRLPESLGRPVEFALFEILASHQSEYFSRRRFQGDDGALAFQILNGLLGEGLDVDVYGGIDSQTSAVDHVAAVFREKMVEQKVGDEIGRSVKHESGFFEILEIELDSGRLLRFFS